MTKKKKRKGQPRREAATPPQFDPRAMEKTMADLTRILSEQDFGSIEEANAFLQAITSSGQVPATAPRTPLQEAQELIYDAWETSGRRKRIALARKALSISPDCADAYVLLAQESAETLEEAVELLREGVAAGERALGPEGFSEYEDHFWGALETRPYMRARAELAMALQHTGHEKESIYHCRELLRLNPGDNQGIRYMLVHLLFEAGDKAALEELLREYEGDWSATWAYTQALLTFCREGASARANKLLQSAIEYNPYVVAFLLGVLEVPDHMPEYYSPGDENEAIDYIISAIPSWLETGGALPWLSEVAGDEIDKLNLGPGAGQDPRLGRR
jgi:tetratricopeptide (TPR) repeat protein